MARMVAAYVALGSNIDNPRAQVERALGALARMPRSVLHSRSRLYRTRPWGFAAQPDFINAVARVDTLLPPREFLAQLLAIEAAAGRERTLRYGPRTLDLDLLLHGDACIEEADLVLPHPRMHERAFVLRPLADIAPQLVIAGHGGVARLLAALDAGGCLAVE